MALTFLLRADHLNLYNDYKGGSRFVVDGNLIHYAYPDSLDGFTSGMHTFYRNLNTQSAALSTPQDVFGANPNGVTEPDMVRMNDGTLICGANFGIALTPARGFAIRESADGGVTWGSLYQPGGFQNHFFYGFGTDGLHVFALTGPVPASILVRHYRTAIGTWVPLTIFQGSSGDSWQPANPSPNNILLNGSRALIVAGRYKNSVPGIACLHTDDLTTWSESIIATEPGLAGSQNIRRIAHAQMGTDGRIRSTYSFHRADLVTPIIRNAYSSDYGKTWTIAPEPPVFVGLDGNGQQIYWPGDDFDVCPLSLDAQNNWFLAKPQMSPGTAGVIHTFKSADSTTWTLIDTSTPITNGAGATYDPSVISPSPATSCFVGKNYFRMVDVWNDPQTRAEKWFLKNVNIGAGTGGGPSGGGGQPIKYPDV